MAELQMEVLMGPRVNRNFITKDRKGYYDINRDPSLVKFVMTVAVPTKRKGVKIYKYSALYRIVAAETQEKLQKALDAFEQKCMEKLRKRRYH